MSEPYTIPMGDRDHVGDRDPESRLIAILDGEEPEPDSDGAPDHDLLMARLRDLLQYLAPDEADAIELRALGKRQEDTCRLFDLTQAAVSYRERRGRKRLRWLISHPEYIDVRKNLERVRRDLEMLPGFRGQRREIYPDLTCAFIETTCASEAARRVGRSQGGAYKAIVDTIPAELEKAAAALGEPYTTYLAVLRVLLARKNVLWSADVWGSRKRI